MEVALWLVEKTTECHDENVGIQRQSGKRGEGHVTRDGRASMAIPSRHHRHLHLGAQDIRKLTDQHKTQRCDLVCLQLDLVSYFDLR